MNRWLKTVGITAALAVAIPLSAYAAANTGTNAADGDSGSGQTSAGAKPFGHGRGPGGQPPGIVSQDVLDVLKLDKQQLQEKIESGKTLAEIATEQGISRDALEQAMTDAFAKRQAEAKQQFADNLDSIVDGKLQDMMGKGPGKKLGAGAIAFDKADLSAVADLLGMTSDELKESIRSGKSIADLAAGKNVDVQKLIDAAKTAIVANLNQAVDDGKLTREQADKQIANAADMAEKIVNGKGFREERGGHRRGPGPIGAPGDGPAGADDSQTDAPATSSGDAQAG